MHNITKSCPSCSKNIRANNYLRHVNSCGKEKQKKPSKVRGVDYDPNWGYAAGIRTIWNKGKTGIKGNRILSDEDIFIENSTYGRCSLKRRIITDKIIPYICSECNNPGEYNGKPLSLHLDHANGINNDNRVENLRFLCPNCHSQTETYAGKNIGKNKSLISSVG